MNYIEELFAVFANRTSDGNKWRCVGTYFTFDQAIDSIEGYTRCMFLENPNDYTIDGTAGDDLNRYYLTNRETGEIIVEFCVKKIFQREHSRLF